MSPRDAAATSLGVEGLCRFQAEVVQELTCMAELDATTADKAARAQKIVMSDPKLFSDDSVMSVSDAASLALELA